MLPTPHPTSLPTVAPPLATNGLNVFHPIARKDSRSVVPMTPPMSPTDPDSRMDDMLVDHPVPHSKDSDVDHLSIQDSEPDPESLPVHSPIRTSDESRECLPRSLRLIDFEVRGTLGTSPSYCFAHPLLRNPCRVPGLTTPIAIQVLARLGVCCSFDSAAPPTKRDLSIVSLSRSFASRKSSDLDRLNT